LPLPFGLPFNWWVLDPGGIGGVAAILGHHLSQLETWENARKNSH